MMGLSEQLLVFAAAREGDRTIPGFKIWPVITIRLLKQPLYHISTGKAIRTKHCDDGDIDVVIAYKTTAITKISKKIKFKQWVFFLHFLRLPRLKFGKAEFSLLYFWPLYFLIYHKTSHIIKTFYKLEDTMTVNKLFRFELTIKLDIDVEEIKETDYGRNRYSKELLNHLLKDTEAVRAFLLLFILSRYINDSGNQISMFMDTMEKEDFYVLRAAKKCTPEARCYVEDAVSGVDEENDDTDIDPDTCTASEYELLSRYLYNKLGNINPVKVDFLELPGEMINHDHDTMMSKEMEH